jgi:glycosyltransferase involved in cell wall biosynthesis
VPLVLEVNHLVVSWARESRGAAHLLGPLSTRVERFVFDRARLLVAISDVVRDQLLAAGVPGERVIVSPNGVDPEVFRPDVDGSPVRRRLGLEGHPVVGFIGTFGHWHGVERLAEAIPEVLAARSDVRFLLVGDGPLRGEVQARVQAAGVADHVVFTGLLPYAEAPAHLAACDVLVSPHVPARTGRFIGSPTKLFEYMATGRGIVASGLEQLAQVLEHERTALLVPPGDAGALARGILELVRAPERARRLGEQARRVVLDRYTWAHGARRVLSALRAVS